MVKYADRMTSSGYSLPDDMNADMMKLKKTPIDKINFDDFKAPTAYNFKANEKDFTQLDAAMKGIEEKKDSATVQGKGFTIDLGEKGKPGYQSIEIPETEQFTIKDKYAVLNRVDTALIADAMLKNAAVDQANLFQNNLKSIETDTDSLIKKQLAKITADKILIAYPEIQGDITKATPSMVIAANRGYLDRKTLGTSVSMKEFNAKLAALKLNMSDKSTQERLNIARNRILGKNSSVSAGILGKIIETGGELWQPEQLEDMGITKDMIEKARKKSIELYLQRGYRPGALQ
jgi:hypothetical protein